MQEREKKMKRVLLVLILIFLIFGPNAWARNLVTLRGRQETVIRKGQSIFTEVALSQSGNIHVKMTLTNESQYWDFCGVSFFAFVDHKGNILEIQSVPEGCVEKSIPLVKTAQREILWEGELKDKSLLLEIADIKIRAFEISNNIRVLLALKAREIGEIFK